MNSPFLYATTVGDLKQILSELPDDMKVLTDMADIPYGCTIEVEIRNEWDDENWNTHKERVAYICPNKAAKP
jgi:hypothetical protein